MTNREVMQQALEALEELNGLDTETECVTIDVGDVIAALRTALEQQAEPVCPECKATVLYECVACSSNNYPPQQQAEPPPEWPLIKNILVEYGLDAIAFVAEWRAAQQQAEPVAWFDWMPKGATHIAQIKVKTTSGGKLELRTHAFKYDNEVLMVYTTDNDNEYPGWREAKQCFYHLNFPVFPLYTAPPQRQWVGLTDEEFHYCIALKNTTAIAEEVEAKLKERNT